MNRKVFWQLFFLCAVFSLLTGCRKQSTSFCRVSENDIPTYTRIDPSKTQLVIGLLRINSAEPLISNFQKIYPDIQPIVVIMQTRTDGYDPSLDWLKHGLLPDIMFNIDVLPGKNNQYFEDLSGSSISGRYSSISLENEESGGKIYSFPGPAKIMVFAYNKDLFTKYAWNEPKTFDEFITLCDRIRKDTNGTVEPYNPNGKYTEDFILGMEAFAYGKLFGGIDNKGWYDDFIYGRGSFKEHMLPFFEMAQRMIDHGLIRPEHFTYSYTLRSKEFAAGKIAMMNVILDADFEKKHETVAFRAFPALNDRETYLALRRDFNEVKIKKIRSSAEKKAADDFLDYISTPAAQDAYIGGSCMLSCVNDAHLSFTPAAQILQKNITEGRYFSCITFRGGIVPSSLNILELLRTEIAAMARREKTAVQAAADSESSIQKAEAAVPAAGKEETLCTVKESFSILETSEYIADTFRKKTGADIALIPDNSACCGNINRFFAGPITRSMMDTIKPRSLLNNSFLVKVRMTGTDLLQAMNDPPDYNGGTSDCIYAFSGLHATAAPWNSLGEKYLSVTLANGSPLVPDRLYTVAFWQGMVKEKYAADIVQIYDSSYTDFICTAVQNDREIYPVQDKRMKLIWK